MVCGGLRMYYLWRMDFRNVTGTATSTTVFVVVEVGVALIVSSSPLLRPIYDRIFTAAVPRRFLTKLRARDAAAKKRTQKSDGRGRRRTWRQDLRSWRTWTAATHAGYSAIEGSGEIDAVEKNLENSSGSPSVKSENTSIGGGMTDTES